VIVLFVFFRNQIPSSSSSHVFFVIVNNVRCSSTGASCNDVIDIGILIDSSASMGEEWLISAMAFAIQLTENFTISYDNTRFGMISFSDEAKTEFRFNDYTTKGEVELAVGKVDFQNGSTR
jgi:hypothetical protein